MTGVDIRTYQGKTIQEALTRVRRELGPTAVILHTRQLTKTGLTGTKKIGVEITATKNRSVTAPEERIAVRFRRPAAEDETMPTTNEDAPRPAPTRDSLRARYAAWADFWNDRELPEAIASQFDHWLDESKLAEADPHEPSVRAQIVAKLAEMLVVGQALESRAERSVVAMVGPSGVGKTTSCGKLAARCLVHDKHVAIISLDGDRIGAANQLRTYAEHLDVPFHAACNAHQLNKAFEQTRGCDVVLVDTSSRHANSAATAAELAGMLPAEVERWLVLGVNLRDAYMRQMADRFGPLNCSGLVVTKADETEGRGLASAAIAAAGTPIIYVADGVEGPDGIEPANARRIAERALGGMGTAMVRKAA